MRIGDPSAWAGALVLSSGGLMPGIGPWPLMMGAWAFHHSNDGDPEPGRR
jgi:hypothetical protein